MDAPVDVAQMLGRSSSPFAIFDREGNLKATNEPWRSLVREFADQRTSIAGAADDVVHRPTGSAPVNSIPNGRVGLKVAALDEGSVAFLIEGAGADQTLRDAVQEEIERRLELATRLHDGVCQTVTALLLGLQLASAATEPRETSERLGSVRRLSVDVLTELRRLIRGLRPPDFESGGLSNALSDHVRDCNADGGPAVDFVRSTDEPTTALPLETQSAVYRIAVEAVDHARHRRGRPPVRLTLRPTATGLELEVEGGQEGNQPGFPIRPVKPDVVGSSTFHKFVRLLGAVVTTTPDPIDGDLLSISIPLLQGRK